VYCPHGAAARLRGRCAAARVACRRATARRNEARRFGRHAAARATDAARKHATVERATASFGVGVRRHLYQSTTVQRR
jgi:hypothetical protein